MPTNTNIPRSQQVRITYFDEVYNLVKETYNNGRICLSLVDIDTNVRLAILTHNNSDTHLPLNHIILKDPYYVKSAAPVTDFYGDEQFSVCGILEDLVTQGIISFHGASYKVGGTKEDIIFPICHVNVEFFNAVELAQAIGTSK